MANIPDLYVALEWHSGYPVINIERGRVASLKVKPREAAKLANDIIDALEQSEQENANDRQRRNHPRTIAPNDPRTHRNEATVKEPGIQTHTHREQDRTEQH